MAGKTKVELESQIQQLISERDFLKAKVEKLEKQCNEMISGKYWEATKNERNAGRKSIVTDSMRKEIAEYRAKGYTYREIASTMGLSVGIVHKIHNS